MARGAYSSSKKIPIPTLEKVVSIPLSKTSDGIHCTLDTQNGVLRCQRCANLSLNSKLQPILPLVSTVD